MNGAPKPFLRPREFHDALEGSVGLAEIYRRLRTGDIRNIKVGRSERFLIPSSEIKDWPQRAVEGAK